MLFRSERALCPGDGGRFYVTAQNGRQSVFLLGPFDTHAAALAQVARGRQLAYDYDVRAPWYSYGTARLTHPGVAAPRVIFEGGQDSR